MDFNAILAEMKPVVEQAGEIALRHFQNVKAERKADRSYVTAADREVETFLRDELERRYPDHGIVGEEHGSKGVGSSEYIWAIDPIDGTEPFVLELPVWAVSLGLVNKDGAVCGFVYLPYIRHLFCAVRQGEAYNNDQVIQVHSGCEMVKGTSIVGPSSTFYRFNTTYEGRCLSYGSAAAHMVFVANGKLHGGIFEALNLYDIAGGACVLEAAGGEMRYLKSGEPVDLWETANTPGTRTREAMLIGHPENVARLRSLFAAKYAS